MRATNRGDFLNNTIGDFKTMLKVYRFLTMFVFVGLFLVGCSQENPAADPPDNETLPTTALPSEVPTEVVSPPVIILLAGAESDPTVLASFQSQIEQIAAQQGLAFEFRQILSAETAPENVRLVVVLPPVNDLTGLAGSMPAIRFLALNMPGTSSSGNLITIGAGTSRITRHLWRATLGGTGG